MKTPPRDDVPGSNVELGLARGAGQFPPLGDGTIGEAMKHKRKMDPDCIDDVLLHELADERAEVSAVVRDRAERHMASCDSCNARGADARRFRSMLARSRVPGLSTTQRQALDDRIALLGTEPRQPRPSMGARTYWGLTLAAATIALVIGGARLLDWQSEHSARVQGLAVAAKAKSAARALESARNNAVLLVARVDGVVEIANAAGRWQPLAAGMALPAGSRLRTVAAARVSLPSTAELQLEAGSEVLVESATHIDFFVRLRRGAVGLQVDKRRPDQRFSVLAGRFRASVVGTRFVVRLGDDASAQVVVHEGAVRVDEADAGTDAASETTAVVRAGYQWHAVNGDVSFGPVRARARQDDGHLAGPPATRAAFEGVAPAPAPSAAASEPMLAPAAKGPRAVASRVRPAAEDGRRVLIEVPPQRMSAEEVKRAKATETDAGRRAARAPDAGTTRGPTLPVPE